jgi:hypothetical protein
MDAGLSNAQIKAKVEERWRDLKVGKTSIRDAENAFLPHRLTLSPSKRF